MDYSNIDIGKLIETNQRLNRRATGIDSIWQGRAMKAEAMIKDLLMLPEKIPVGYIGFYEREFYVLSNFSAFTLKWQISPGGEYKRFDTSEAVYHWEKFNPRNLPSLTAYDYQRFLRIQEEIKEASSAHEAYKIAERNKQYRRPQWDDEKVDVMLRIIRAKASQHEYVHRKLMETGDRYLVEDSWRDDFWGWGKNKDGQNMLGKLWMTVRKELKDAVV